MEVEDGQGGSISFVLRAFFGGRVRCRVPVRMDRPAQARASLIVVSRRRDGLEKHCS